LDRTSISVSEDRPLCGFAGEPIAEIVQCGEPIHSGPFRAQWGDNNLQTTDLSSDLHVALFRAHFMRGFSSAAKSTRMLAHQESLVVLISSSRVYGENFQRAAGD
jgi:hypothetical protein